MIVLDVTQGSPEWFTARLGIPTASAFSRILTPKTMKPSAQADPYLHQLLAEWALGEPVEDVGNPFTDRGTALEAQAVAWYEFQTERQTCKVGFVLRDDRRVGCSPDRLVGADGGLEIKCPGIKTHIAYLLGSPGEEHRAQVQGCLWICERSWWDVVSFCPGQRNALIRVERDEEFIEKLAVAVSDFLGRLDGMKERLRALGVRQGLSDD